MKKIKIINISNGKIIAERGLLANNFFSRFKGLIGRDDLGYDEGLCILPCKSVHTCFMKFSIDVIFVDRNDKVCKIIQDLKPWKISGFVKNAKYVIEVPANKSEMLRIEVGDKVEIRIN